MYYFATIFLAIAIVIISPQQHCSCDSCEWYETWYEIDLPLISTVNLQPQPLPEPVETTAPKKWQAERVRSAEAQAWQQAEVALEAAKVRRVVTKGRDGWGMTWWSDWNILKHHQNKVLLCFFLGDEVVIHFGKILYRKVWDRWSPDVWVSMNLA